MSEREPLSIELFPLPVKNGRAERLETLDSGEKYLIKERALKNIIFGLQPVVEGPLDTIRCLVGALLLYETGVNVGYGYQDWRHYTIQEWLERPLDEWLLTGSLGWEVQLGLSCWLAALVGAPRDKAVEWGRAFESRATEAQQRGDFFEMKNDGRAGNIPTIDALVAFFRDMLLNRLLETIPRLRRRVVDNMDSDVQAKIREWLIPPRSLRQYIVDSERIQSKNILRDIKVVAEETSQQTPITAISYGVSDKLSHLELFDLSKLPGYYFDLDYVPPIDQSILPDAVQMFWPSSIQGPTNHIKPPSNFGDFMDKYMRRLHVVIINSYTIGFLIPLVQASASSAKVYERESERHRALVQLRAQAFERLSGLIEEMEPSSIQQTNLKYVLRQWFTDIE